MRLAPQRTAPDSENITDLGAGTGSATPFPSLQVQDCLCSSSSVVQLSNLGAE